MICGSEREQLREGESEMKRKGAQGGDGGQLHSESWSGSMRPRLALIRLRRRLSSRRRLFAKILQIRGQLLDGRTRLF
jgi:hypothetical protein